MQEAALTWYGTNSFLLETKETAILVDPFIQLQGAENPNCLEDFMGAGKSHEVRDVLITHCHFDHIASIPELLSKHPAIAYCTECGVRSLEQEGFASDTIIAIAPGHEFEIGNVTVRVCQGKHINFDVKLVVETLLRLAFTTERQNIASLLYLIRAYSESGETVIYDVHIGGSPGVHIQFMGSLATQDDIPYPTGADYLVLPYQGNSNLKDKAREVIKRLRPEHVIASHFDDAFPPVSSTVDLTSLQELMQREFPDIPLIIPKVKDPIGLIAQSEAEPTANERRPTHDEDND